jgi:hypothetical protein
MPPHSPRKLVLGSIEDHLQRELTWLTGLIGADSSVAVSKPETT